MLYCESCFVVVLKTVNRGCKVETLILSQSQVMVNQVYVFSLFICEVLVKL